MNRYRLTIIAAALIAAFALYAALDGRDTIPSWNSPLPPIEWSQP